jgi:hypothetical protein
VIEITRYNTFLDIDPHGSLCRYDDIRNEIEQLKNDLTAMTLERDELKNLAVRMTDLSISAHEGEPFSAREQRLQPFHEASIQSAVDEIDAGFFSGDAFFSAQDCVRMEYYIGRWERQIAEIRANNFYNEDDE